VRIRNEPKLRQLWGANEPEARLLYLQPHQFILEISMLFIFAFILKLTDIGVPRIGHLMLD
jgi:hypothetical protein